MISKKSRWHWGLSALLLASFSAEASILCGANCMQRKQLKREARIEQHCDPTKPAVEQNGKCARWKQRYSRGGGDLSKMESRTRKGMASTDKFRHQREIAEAKHQQVMQQYAPQQAPQNTPYVGPWNNAYYYNGPNNPYYR